MRWGFRLRGSQLRPPDGRHLGAYEADNAQRSPLEAAIAQLPKDKAQQLIEFVRSEKAKRAA